MTDDAATPRDTVIAHMEGTVPERKGEIASLWQKYNPDVVLAADAKRVTLNADKDRIIPLFYESDRWVWRLPHSFFTR